MSQLFYRFDARKLVNQADFAVPNASLFDNADAARAAVINEFKAIMGNANNRVFETIWGNPALKVSLFGGANEVQARLVFANLVADEGSILFNFIKIE